MLLRRRSRLTHLIEPVDVEEQVEGERVGKVCDVIAVDRREEAHLGHALGRKYETREHSPKGGVNQTSQTGGQPSCRVFSAVLGSKFRIDFILFTLLPLNCEKIQK